MRFIPVCIVLATVILGSLLMAAVANGAPSPMEAEDRVGDNVTARFVCKDVGFLKAILSLEDDVTITAAANASLDEGHCAWSSMPFPVTLLEYMGFVDMKIEPPGRAYIYRVEDPDGDSHYMYMWVETRPT